MEKFYIEPMTMESLSEAISILAKGFCRRGTLVGHLKLDEGPYAQRLEKIGPAIVDQGFSFIARDAATGRAIACWLCFRKDLVFEDNSYPAIQPLLEVHRKLNYPEYVLNEPQSVLYCYLVSSLTPKEGGAKGTSAMLAHRVFENAKAKGIKYAMGILTSPVIKKMWKQNFGDLCEQEFDVSTAGVPQFADYHETIILAILDLKTLRPPHKQNRFPMHKL